MTPYRTPALSKARVSAAKTGKGWGALFPLISFSRLLRRCPDRRQVKRVSDRGSKCLERDDAGLIRSCNVALTVSNALKFRFETQFQLVGKGFTIEG